MKRYARPIVASVLCGLSACGRDASYEGRSADQWTGALTSGIARERASAVAALAAIGPRQWSHMRPLLLATNDSVTSIGDSATAAVRRLPENSQKALLKGLSDSNVMIRRAAAMGLGHFRDGDDDAIQALVAATRDSDDSVRTLAVLSLGERSVGARAALDRIRELASQPGPQRAAALLVWPNIDTETHSFAGTYYPALNDTSAAVRAAAATMLPSAGGGHDAMPLLVKALEDPERSVRIAAAKSLAYEARHDTIAYDALVSLRASPDTLMRRLADSTLRTVSRSR